MSYTLHHQEILPRSNRVYHAIASRHLHLICLSLEFSNLLFFFLLIAYPDDLQWSLHLGVYIENNTLYKTVIFVYHTKVKG